MPLVMILRSLGSLLSLAVLGVSIYLGWRWYEGTEVVLADGTITRVREDWRLWTAVGLLALMAVGGRLLIATFLGRRDSDQTCIKLRRGEGTTIDSPTCAKLYVEEQGDKAKPTIVFTHGWGLDSTIWAYVKRDLAADFRLVFWDLPGTGKSRPGPDSRLDPIRFAKDLQAVVEHASVQKVILVGHSIGGMTIQSLLREAPAYVREKAAGIVLLNTTYTNPLRTMAFGGFFRSIRWIVLEPMLFLTWLLQPLAWLDAWRMYLSGWAHVANRVQFGKTATRSQLEAVTLLGTRNPQGALAKGNLGMFRWDATGVLRNAPCPVLVIGGKDDLVTKPDASRELASSDFAQLMLVEDVNHNGFLENAQTYHRAIANFTRRSMNFPMDKAQTANASAEDTGDILEVSIRRPEGVDSARSSRSRMR